MRAVRLLLWYVVGFLLGAWAVVSHAETIPATSVPYTKVPVTCWTAYSGGGCGPSTVYDSTGEALCTKLSSANTPKTFWIAAENSTTAECRDSGGSRQNTLYKMCPAGYNANSIAGQTHNYCYSSATSYTCPTGQNWTLSGSTCTRPDCPNGRNADGTCVTDCPMYSGTQTDSLSATAPAGCSCPSGTKWYPYNGCRKTCPYAANETIASGWPYQYKGAASIQCVSGCEALPTGAVDTYANGYSSASMQSTGWACGGGGVNQPVTPDNTVKDADPTTKKPPPCPEGQGVITSSSGKVMCLPAGTPNTTPPKVQQTKEVKTFPDNSTQTTQTTKTTDPNTGATSVSQTVTVSGGMAGTSGTATSNTDTSGSSSGNGDPNKKTNGDADCDPTKHMCGSPGTEGIYKKKEKTVGDVLGKFRTDFLNTPAGKAATDFFTVTTPSGSCPSWVVSVAFLNVTLDLSQHFCTSTAISMMDLAGAVLLALVTFVAFRWAIL